MKNKNLPEEIEKEELPFSFKRQKVSAEEIKQHWERIASIIANAKQSAQQPNHNSTHKH